MKPVANKCCASITPRTVKTKSKKRLMASQLKCNGDNNISFLTKQLHRCLGNACERRGMYELYLTVTSIVNPENVAASGFRKLSNHTTHLTRSILAQYEKFAHKVSIKGRTYDGMDTDHDCSYKRITNWKHQNPNSTNPRSTNYNLRHHLNPNCKETYRH